MKSSSAKYLFAMGSQYPWISFSAGLEVHFFIVCHGVCEMFLSRHVSSLKGTLRRPNLVFKHFRVYLVYSTPSLRGVPWLERSLAPFLRITGDSLGAGTGVCTVSWSLISSSSINLVIEVYITDLFVLSTTSSESTLEVGLMALRFFWAPCLPCFQFMWTFTALKSSPGVSVFIIREATGLPFKCRSGHMRQIAVVHSCKSIDVIFYSSMIMRPSVYGCLPRLPSNLPPDVFISTSGGVTVPPKGAF